MVSLVSFCARDGPSSSVVDRGGLGAEAPPFGGKKFKIEIDTSIWRDEIQSSK